MLNLFKILLFISTIAFSQENTIVDIQVIGLKKTKRSFINKIIAIKSNITLDSLQLKTDIERLKRLPAISHAYFTVQKNKANYQVIYHIEENRTLIPNVNIWTTTENQFSYKVGVNEFNFLGKGIGIGAYYQNNGYDTYGINFSAPYLFSKKIGISLAHQSWKSKEPLYFKNNVAQYAYHNTSYEVLAMYEVNFRHKISLGTTFFNEKYKYKSGSITSNTPTQLDLDKLLFKTIYEYNNLNYNYQYIEGFKSLFTGQYVPSTNPGQDNFLMAWNDFFYYKKINSKGNWANRLRLGLATNSESPFAPFALDNNVNIRGIGNLVDRGTGSIVLNTEYRHTFFEKKGFILQGNTFIDAGSWRKPGGKLTDFLKMENTQISPGIGVRLMHKRIYNAIFRIDYGYGLTKNASQGIVFGIGQYF